MLPDDLHRLRTLDVGGNSFTKLTLPSGLTELTGLFFVGNQLAALTLPPDMTNLVSMGFLANPLVALLIPGPLASTDFAAMSTCRERSRTRPSSGAAKKSARPIS